MKYLIPLLIIFIIFAGLIKESEFPAALIENAEKYNTTFPAEHVYIITDKSYFKPGDELWFKAVVRNTLPEQELSNDLNIKLIDVFGNQILNLRLPLHNNEANGYLVLPGYVQEGKYYLIGYTGWMKNLPVSEIFRKEIIISNHIERTMQINLSLSGKLYYPGDKVEGSVKISFPDGTPLGSAKYTYTCKSEKKIINQGYGRADENGNGQINFELPREIESDLLWLEFTVKHKKKVETYIKSFPIAGKYVDVQFFPEGGKLITGFENRVAFKAVDGYELPVEIEGFVIDESGKQVCRIESSYMGMGVFSLKPEHKKYILRLIKPVVENNIITLPEVSPSGIQLNYRGISGKEILFSIRSSNTTRTEKINMVVEQFGKIKWAAVIDFMNHKVITVPCEKFENGLIKCTLFDNTGNVIASRAIMVEKTQSFEELSFVASKDYFGIREKVFLELGSPVNGNFSATLTVSNDKYIDDNEISLNNYLNCYVWLKDANPILFSKLIKQEDLDLILLTHESKSLPLTGLVRNDFKYSLPYYNQDGITGQVLDKKSNPVENARVKLIHSVDLRIFQASTDAKGVFNIKFDNRIINYNFLNVAIADESGKAGSNLTIYDHYSDNILRLYNTGKDTWKFNQSRDLIKYENPLFLFSGKYRQGRIKEKREFTGRGYDYKKYSTYLNLMDVIKELRSYDLVNGEIRFSGRKKSPAFQKSALIVIDGIVMGNNADILSVISPKEVRNINISTSPIDIQRYTALNSMGIIEISTIQGVDNMENMQKSEIQQDILMLDHEFIGPDYSIDEIPRSDTRTTLFWKPDVIFENTSSAKIIFYTSDVTGTYVCIINGTDPGGNFFSRRIGFVVK